MKPKCSRCYWGPESECEDFNPDRYSKCPTGIEMFWEKNLKKFRAQFPSICSKCGKKLKQRSFLWVRFRVWFANLRGGGIIYLKSGIYWCSSTVKTGASTILGAKKEGK